MENELTANAADLADAQSTTRGASGAKSRPDASNRKHGVPVGSLKDAEQLAKALWDVGRNGYVAQPVLGQKLNVVAEGGYWRRKLALLNSFGLLDKESRVGQPRIRVSDLGKRLLNDADPSAQRQARREATLNIATYKTLIESFGSESLPDDDTLSTLLHFNHGLKKQDSLRAAKCFRETVEYAGLLDADGAPVVGEDKSVHEDAVEDLDETDEFDDEDLEEAVNRKDIAVDMVPPPDGGTSVERKPQRVTLAASGPDVRLRASIDLSRYSADDVIRILHTLGLGVNG